MSEYSIDKSEKATTPRWKSLTATIVVYSIHLTALLLAGHLHFSKGLFLFFFLTLTIYPGWLISTLLFPDARLHFRLLLSFVMGTSHFFLFLLFFALFRLDITYIAILIPVSAIGISLLLDRTSFRGFDLPHNDSLKRPVMLLAVLISVFVSIITLGPGDPILLTGDSQDHIAYIDAVSRSHEVFPEQFIYRDGGMLTRDLRKGLLHSMWGTIDAVTRSGDFLPSWPLISWIGSLLLLLSILCLGIQLFGSQYIGILGVILYILFYQRGLAGHSLTMAAYGFYFGKLFYFSFLMFLPSCMRKPVWKNILPVAISSFAAVGTHISYIMIMAFVMLAFFLFEYFQTIREKRLRLLTRAMPLTSLAVVLPNIPYLLMRYVRDYNPANEIHTHVHGMLFLTDKLAVVNPILLYHSDGPLMILALAAVILLWKPSRRDANLRLVLGAVSGVFILVFNPLWVPFIMNRITYLIVRFAAAPPFMLIAAYLLYALYQGMKGRGRVVSRTVTVTGWIIVVILLTQPLIRNFTQFAWAGAPRRTAMGASALNLRDLFTEIKKNVPAGAVIASDPMTGYCIPAFSDDFTLCTYDQHSTPNDSTALDRIRACRDIYLPQSSCRDITEILEEYGAGYIVINGRIPKRVRGQYWTPDRDAAEAAAANISACDNFSEIYSHDSIYLFKVLGKAGEDTVNTRRRTLKTYEGDFNDLAPSGVDGIYISGGGVSRNSIDRGDTLRLYVEWSVKRPVRFGSYVTYIRFDTDFDKGPLFRSWYGKVYRKILEKISGQRYRFRDDRLPFDGIFPPDTWPEGSILRDEFRIIVPGDIAPGRYTISVKLDNAPHVSNLRLKDLLSDDDFYDGPDLMTIEIK
jgi:hypothetical protein